MNEALFTAIKITIPTIKVSFSRSFIEVAKPGETTIFLISIITCPAISIHNSPQLTSVSFVFKHSISSLHTDNAIIWFNIIDNAFGIATGIFIF
jgi:hypothetical protein